ncbi:sigma-70 family RNA polymerase sigma factor [Nostoc sp. UHCC 0926]|uniref:RNA polymerase sigma factor n=1 Tax=unclassified Nostoc TaxID=2593658 RepID=UPI00235DF0EB|nr:sigma-70 family RNA polymerase sigma factor [Nostoc sp. UHCC 0926]WDD31449.1 sigma-70 family RNA polymerase sigma factor [Nostoc sp. UHCC 0926]
MQVNFEQKAFISLAGLETKNLPAKQIRLQGLSRSDRDFWHLWEQYQDYLYSCCLQWMGGNRHDAEDLFSLAMLKAWNQWPDYANKITKPRAWLSRLIHNLCMDLHRERKREAQRIKNVEDIQFRDHAVVTSRLESPESEMFGHELRAYLRHRIESLPTRLREPFILRYCQEKSYRDIAKQLALCEDNVYKRVQQARTILQKQLSKYLAGEDDTSLDSFPPRFKWVVPMVESKPDQRVISDWEVPITTSIEEINYKVTVTCLESLQHTWYSSPSLLGWR